MEDFGIINKEIKFAVRQTRLSGRRVVKGGGF